jgi:hypothetical protein
VTAAPIATVNSITAEIGKGHLLGTIGTSLQF